MAKCSFCHLCFFLILNNVRIYSSLLIEIWWHCSLIKTTKQVNILCVYWMFQNCLLTSCWPSEMSCFTILMLIFTGFGFSFWCWSLNHIISFVNFDTLVYWTREPDFSAESPGGSTSLHFTCYCRTWTLIIFGEESSHVCCQMAEAYTIFYTKSFMPSTQHKGIICMIVW